ncbi:MAG: hypothetical protein ACREQO_17025 [Candidatus Binatia bacterium]
MVAIAIGTLLGWMSVAIHGMISLERGFIFTSMILAAIGVALIERQFVRAGSWRSPRRYFRHSALFMPTNSRRAE